MKLSWRHQYLDRIDPEESHQSTVFLTLEIHLHGPAVRRNIKEVGLPLPTCVQVAEVGERLDRGARGRPKLHPHGIEDALFTFRFVSLYAHAKAEPNTLRVARDHNGLVHPISSRDAHAAQLGTASATDLIRIRIGLRANDVGIGSLPRGNSLFELATFNKIPGAVEQRARDFDTLRFLV